MHEDDSEDWPRHPDETPATPPEPVPSEPEPPESAPSPAATPGTDDPAAAPPTPPGKLQNGSPPPPPGAERVPAGIPWEQRDRIGTLPALFQTIKLSLFSPTEFFSLLPPQEPSPPPPLGGVGSALLYAILVGVPSLAFGLFWQLLASSMGVMFGETREAVLSLGTSLVAAAFSPLFILVSLLVTSLVFHLFLNLFGGARYSFVATFRVLCYAAAPEILQVVPLCGGIASGIWWFVLCVIGLATVHRTSVSRSFAAVTVPTIACCGFLLLVGLMAGVATLLHSWN
jgi:hypothetical protein